MISSKNITKFVAALMAAAVLLCLGATAFSSRIVAAASGTGVTVEYEGKLFDKSEVLEVNILMDDADWQALLDNAMSEEYVQCDVEIAGETFYRVGIRPKGNTSLSSIANDPTTDRYSLKLEFDQYVDGQTCFGLDKLILNNSYADTTYMKEALIYDLFHELGADASLYNYAKVSVNGEYWGLYLALEAVEDSFLLRNYGAESGALYKPDSMNMGGGERSFGNTQPMQPSEKNAETMQMPDFGEFDFTRQGGGKGGFGGGMFGNGGANLNYIDDNLDSYATIWDGEVTNTGDSDHKRVVTALRSIAQGSDLETYMDVDNLVRYMAVHIFSQNDDSLSGSMAHNYYLYEHNGQLNLLPWDYNLAFGGMGMSRSGATDMVNGGIDNAWSSTEFFDTLLADETHHAAYLSAMTQVVDYIQSGKFDDFYNRTRGLIDELVRTDPNAFYTYEEYLTGVETLYEVVKLRAQSIQGQLDGSIPTTDSAQKDSAALIDASHIDLSALGSMNMGGGREEKNSVGGFSPDNLPENIGAAEPPQDFDPTAFAGQRPESFEREDNADAQRPQSQFQNRPVSGNVGNLGDILIYFVSAVILLAAFLYALFYRRRPRKR